MSFELASRLQRVSDGTFRAQVPDGWQQGRGAFGGLVIGSLCRAALAVETEPARRLRVVTAEILAPVLPGDAEVVVEVLRRGNNLSQLDARLSQGTGVVARASVTLGAARKSSLTRAPAPPPPASVAWAELDPLPVRAPLGPTFAQHYEYRCSGPIPFSGAERAETAGFVREKIPPAALDAPAVIALLDAFWPAMFSVETQRLGAATVSFTAELLVDPRELPADEPLQHVGRMAAVDGGFMTEFRELWSHGRLVAMNQQVMALLP